MNQNFSQAQAEEMAAGKTATETQASQKEQKRNLQVRTGIKAGEGGNFIKF